MVYGNISYETLRAPTPEFALIAQSIGYQSWARRFTQRSDGEIRQMFAPDGAAQAINAEKSLQRMQEKSTRGKFCGVLALQNSRVVGFGWSADDTAVSVQQPPSDTPYVWMAHLNVLPDFQGNGIGRGLISNILQNFDSDQKPAAYVFDENQPTIRLFEGLGFVKNPGIPRVKHDYFGDAFEPVQQWRLEAPSVAEVLSNLQTK